MDTLMKEKSNLIKVLMVLGVLISIYVLVLIFSEMKSYGYIGGGINATNTISFDGTGDVSAAPDLATISFTLVDSEPVLKDAQTKVTAKESSVLDFLSKSGIAKKDIKTENYSSYPKYSNVAPCYSGVNIPCPPYNPQIIGYEVSENISVKVHDLTKAGDVVKGIGDVGVSDLSGPNFSIEDEDNVKAEARKIAIDDAKAKAQVLARDLGVKLVRIVGFSENNGTYPIAYTAKAMDAGSVAPSAAPQLPTGENKITSNVTITYEVR